MSKRKNGRRIYYESGRRRTQIPWNEINPIGQGIALSLRIGVWLALTFQGLIKALFVALKRRKRFE